MRYAILCKNEHSPYPGYVVFLLVDEANNTVLFASKQAAADFINHEASELCSYAIIDLDECEFSNLFL